MGPDLAGSRLEGVEEHTSTCSGRAALGWRDAEPADSRAGPNRPRSFVVIREFGSDVAPRTASVATTLCPPSDETLTTTRAIRGGSRNGRTARAPYDASGCSFLRSRPALGRSSVTELRKGGAFGGHADAPAAPYGRIRPCFT